MYIVKSVVTMETGIFINRLSPCRSDGCSGIKQVRHQRDGSKPYYTETHIGSGVASIHDHADSVATMGMGEFHVVRSPS